MIDINIRKEDVDEEVHGEAEPDRSQDAFEACDKSGAKGFGLGRGGGVREIGSGCWKFFHDARWVWKVVIMLWCEVVEREEKGGEETKMR